MLLMSMMTLVACGGGDGDLTGGGDGGTSGGQTISLAISNQNITGEAPITVLATLSGGTTVDGVLISFSSTLGAFSPSLGTALTDSSGVAEIILTAGAVRGAGEITASASSGATTTIGFTTQGDDVSVVGDTNITLSLVNSDGQETDTITSSKSGKVIATIEGISSSVIVTFSTTVGEIPISTAITNDLHQASVDILAGSSLGAGTITASINSGETGELLLVVGSSSVTMGSGDPFEESVAGISLAQISAGGTTVISVNIIDDQGELFTEAVDVNFSSGCTSLATPTAELSSPITTSNGIATSTYLAKGCVGDDPINVTANAGGINLSASTSVNVLPASVGSIEFVSSLPEVIGILGTGAVGGSESSVIKFRVLDTNSNPVNNQVVNFTLNSDVGGIKLIPASATTNSDGIVQTVVNSGTVATSVRVTAEIDGSAPVIASQSSLLVISTGIPDQDSFSLSADILNPEGWNTDGTIVVVTARLADAFNNPVPDGTGVSFTTEGGRIEPSCVTENGTCSVEWNSQNTRPEGHVLQHNADEYSLVSNMPTTVHDSEIFNTLGQKFGGRATILATAIGEESFPDLNGNARFDASEMSAFLATNISGKPYDLKEAFVDHNEDGLYNPSEGGDINESGKLEEFSDFNSDNLFTGKDSKYNGVLCSIPAHDGCSSTAKSLNVRDSITLVMSGSSAFFTTNSTIDAVAITIDGDGDDSDNDGIIDVGKTGAGGVATPMIPNPDFEDNDSVININGEAVGGATVTISDLHNQPMPAGTTIEFTASVGSVVGPSSFVWPNDNHNGGQAYSVSVKGEKEPKSGSLIIEVTTPGGLATLYGAIGITIH
jgi:hypothetical protein